MKRVILAVLIATVLALGAFLCWEPSPVQAQAGAQNVLTQTTLSAAVPALAGTLFSSTQTFVQVASATGITAIAPNPTVPINASNSVVIYVDRELMQVVAVSGTTLRVIRGYDGTTAVPHASGAMVLAGQATWFYHNDPGGGRYPGQGVSGVACTPSAQIVTPWVNIYTGAQWLCSSISGTYVPGFNNPLIPEGAVTTTAVASVAGTTLPSGPLFHVTGTNAITGWTIPVGCNATAVGGCSFTIIPDAICTWTAAGNIALAGSCVVNKALTFTWDAKNSKWIPSYIA